MFCSALRKSCGPCASWCVAAPLGRLLLASLFLMSAYGKITGFDGQVAYAASVGLPFAQYALYGAIFLELVGSALLILGYHARLGAGMLILFTAVATYYFHTDFSGDMGMMQQIMFMKNLSIIGGLLMVVGNGAGHWSLDARCCTASGEKCEKKVCCTK